MRHFDKNQILTDKQHGFRARRSCETQLISTIQEIARNMTQKGQVDVILLDFAKAFDKVPHHRLLHKLNTGPRSAVGNVSGYRCVSDCRSRGREFDPGPVPYFRGD